MTGRPALYNKQKIDKLKDLANPWSSQTPLLSANSSLDAPPPASVKYFADCGEFLGGDRPLLLFALVGVAFCSGKSALAASLSSLPLFDLLMNLGEFFLGLPLFFLVGVALRLSAPPPPPPPPSRLQFMILSKAVAGVGGTILGRREYSCRAIQ